MANIKLFGGSRSPSRMGSSGRTRAASKEIGAENKKRRSNRGKKKRSGFRTAAKILAVLLVFEALYFTAVYSNIPFIAKWRTLYIETAMSTLNHQWLATAFIPESVINDALKFRYETSEMQQNAETNWGLGDNDPSATSAFATASLKDRNDSQDTDGDKPQQIAYNEQEAFFELFYELDCDSMVEYTEKNPDVLANGWMSIKINEAGLSQSGIDVYTADNEQVLAIDAENEILLLRVKGDGYRGVLAKVKDPSTLSVAHAHTLGDIGQFASVIAEKSGAVLAMNASGFADVAGVGNGGIVGGLSIASGVSAGSPALGNYKRMEIRSDNRMYIVSSYAGLNSDTRDAVEFLPALIVDGETLISGSAGWGIQPRSVIAQSDKLEYLLLVVEGREVLDGIIGITLGECVDILHRHNAVQALNLDGGSSSIMVYEGEPVTRNSNASKNVEGRTLPNAFVVIPKS